MALPTKKKRGLRVLTHQGINYYWKVRVDDDYAECSLIVTVGLEKKSSSFFHVFFLFKDPFLHFPIVRRSPEQNTPAIRQLKALEKISPGFIVNAIDKANEHRWEETRHFALVYKNDGTFSVTENWDRKHL